MGFMIDQAADDAWCVRSRVNQVSRAFVECYLRDQPGRRGDVGSWVKLSCSGSIRSRVNQA